MLLGFIKYIILTPIRISKKLFSGFGWIGKQFALEDKRKRQIANIRRIRRKQYRLNDEI